jgi:cell division protein FtsL
MQERVKDLEEEMEMKSGENNRLRKQVTDLDSAMKDLYKISKR